VIGSDDFLQDIVSFDSPVEKFGILIMPCNVSFNGVHQLLRTTPAGFEHARFQKAKPGNTFTFAFNPKSG
jgi:hypothetical protein